MAQIFLDQTDNILSYGMEGQEPQQAIVKGNTDKLFRYAYQYNTKQTEAYLKAYEKELATLVKIPEVTTTAVDKSINRHIASEIKKRPEKIISEFALSFLQKIGDSKKAYYNFLSHLYTNPIQEIRETLLDTIIKYKLPITPEGYIVGVRQVVKLKESGNNENWDFIQTEHFKVKTKWKKSAKNYFVDFETKTIRPKTEEDSPELNLQYLFDNMDKTNKVVYTDQHTKTMRWSIGDVCAIKRSFTRTQLTCGSEMLHIRTNPKEFESINGGGHGDTNILVLINPRDVVSAKEPHYKIGVCRFYFAALYDKKEYDLYFKEPLTKFDFAFSELDKKIQEDFVKVYQGEFSPEFYQTIVDNRVEWF